LCLAEVLIDFSTVQIIYATTNVINTAPINRAPVNGIEIMNTIATANNANTDMIAPASAPNSPKYQTNMNAIRAMIVMNRIIEVLRNTSFL